MNAGFEALALIIGLATVLSFIAKKTEQPTVISYILTGLILGPVGIGLLGQTETTQLFSELGLVFLLFFIGLEINISKIREVLEPTVLIGIAQMALSAALGFATGFLLGFTVIESVFLGAAAMFSSTALVVKILTDKDEASTLPGRLDIGILLIQDIVVVLILAILTANFNSITGTLLRFGEILAMIGLVGGISLASSKYLLPKVFKKTSINKHAFFIYGIAWAFILISGAQYLDLSLEIGAFFAGLSLAQLPYSSELQEKSATTNRPIMALFFINFGLQILPEQLSTYFIEAVLASAVLMIGKFGIFFGLTDHMKFTPQTSFKTSINMTQISEFSLILGALAASEQLIGQNFLGFISLVAIITMSSSSYLLNFNEKIYRELEGLVKKITTDEGEDVEIERMDNHAIIIGYNRITERLLPLLKETYSNVVVVDKNPENTRELSESPYEYIYGDFNHGEIRKAAAIEKAGIIISISKDKKVNHQILRDKERETIAFLEADSFEDTAELYEKNADYVIIENIVTGDKMADYLELYLEDPNLFQEEIDGDLETIHWGGRNG